MKNKRPITESLLTLFRCVVTVVAVDVLLIVLLGLSYAVPDHAIVDKAKADIAAGKLSVTYPENLMGGQLDGYTQCIGLTSGVVPVGNTTSIPERVSLIPRGPGCDGIADFFNQVSEPTADPDSLAPAGAYVRYWSGYSIFSRPLLALGGLKAVAAFTGLAIIGSGAFLVWALSRRGLGVAGMALVATYFATTNTLGTFQAFTQGIVEAIMLFGAGVVALVPRKWTLPAVGAAASAFVFMDLLTVPASSWALCTFIVALISWNESLKRKDSAFDRQLILTPLKAGCTWAVAFAFTWSLRWIVAMPTIGVSGVIENVRSYAEFRMNGTTTFGGDDPLPVFDSFGVSTKANLLAWKESGLTASALAIAVIALIWLVYRWGHVRDVGGIRALLSLAVAATFPVIWVEILRNHSQIHTFFVHRSFGMAFAIVIATIFAGTTWTDRFSSGHESATGHLKAEPPSAERAPRHVSGIRE